jgi:hypothetical protein
VRLIAASISCALLAASASTAATTCSRIGDDPNRQQDTLFVDGDEGAFSYIAGDGTRAVVAVRCDQSGDGSHVTLVCARLHPRADGFTTEHYVVPRVSSYAVLIVSSFIENAAEDVLSDGGSNWGRLSQVTVRCTVSP